VNAHLVLFVPGLEAGKTPLHDERREFLAVNLRKHNVNVGKSAVGNPHLLSVQNVVGSFGVQFRARQRILRVRSCLRFGKAVRANPLTGGQLRQIFPFLLFRSEINNRQRANPRVRAVRHREAAVNRKFLRQNRRGNFVQARPAILLGNAAAHQTDFAAFFHQRRHQPGLLVLEVFDEREDFLEDKFLGGLPDKPLIVAQISGREDVARLRRFEKKTAAFCCGLRESSRRHLGRS